MVSRGALLCTTFAVAFSALATNVSLPAEAAAARRAPRVEPLGKALKGPARASYESAKILFDDGDFASALLKFRSAYDEQPDPRLLWNMAVCEKNMRHYQNAKVLIERYLKEGESQNLVTDTDKAQAQALLETVAKFSGTLRVHVAEPGVEVLVDGEAVGTTPLEAPIPIDVGKRTVVLQKPGFRTQTFTREETGGGEWLLQTTMEPQRALLEVKAPENANVALTSGVLGTGTVRTDLAPGRYLLRVSAPDKQPYELELTLDDREHRTITPNLLDTPSGGRAWVWVLAGVAAVTVAAVGGYFLFRPGTAPIEDRNAFTVVELQ